MLHKGYDHNALVAQKEKKSKNPGRDPQGAWHQKELNGGKLPVEK
jgi:hypothetical protein